jgi:hypothetical protein
MDAGLVNFPASFKDVSGTELYAEVASLTSLVYDENVDIA